MFNFFFYIGYIWYTSKSLVIYGWLQRSLQKTGRSGLKITRRALEFIIINKNKSTPIRKNRARIQIRSSKTKRKNPRKK